MISTIKRFSLLMTACASALLLNACETTTGGSATTPNAPDTQAQAPLTMPTLEHLALGMTLNFPACTADVQGENTNIAPIEGKVCQYLIQEGQIEEYKVQNYVVLLSEGVNEGFSAQVNIGVDTIDNKVIRFSIVTPGLTHQEQIFNQLVAKLGQPVDAKLVTENVPNSPVEVNSAVAIWGVEGG
ncbi:MAG: hypothetical protein ACRCWR_11740, partial [Saezia sp.]